MHQRVLDVEVVLVMEDSNLLIPAWTWLLVLVTAVCAFWRDGNCREVDLAVSADRCLRCCCICHGSDCGMKGFGVKLRKFGGVVFEGRSALC